MNTRKMNKLSLKSRRSYILVLFCFLILMLNLAAPMSAQTLIIAQITERPKKDFKELRPMVNFMAQKLSNLGIDRGEVRLFSNIEDLISAVKRGEVHWITETSFTAARLINESNARLIATKWKQNQRNYSSIIFTRKGNQIKSVKDLVGKVIAFESPESFSSYFVPRRYLESQGLKMQHLKSVRDSPDPDKVGFVFSLNEKNNALWVDKGLVVAGVLNNGDWNNEARVPPTIKSSLAIIYRSQLYPRALEIIGPGLDDKIAEALKTQLLEMNNLEDKSVLYRYEKSTGFSEITNDIHQKLDEVYQNSLKWQAL